MSNFGIIALQPALSREFAQPSIAMAASRAGACGAIDAELLEDDEAIAALVALVASSITNTTAGIGIKFGVAQFLRLVEQVKSIAAESRLLIILTPGAPAYELKSLQKAATTAQGNGWRVFVEAIGISEAKLAESVKADGIIAKGHEAGGRVGEETTFVLVQRLALDAQLPVWAHGGIGVHTAAACKIAGAAGVVLDWQLALVRESSLPLPMKVKVARMDGTEPRLFSGPGRQHWRAYTRTGSTAGDALVELSKKEDAQAWYESFRRASMVPAGTTGDDEILPCGQDIAFAAKFSERFGTTAGVIDGILSSVDEHLRLAGQVQIVGENSPLAKSHKTRYPIVQGAMTRVSDTAEFALKVAEGGALPFLALALMRAREIEKLLVETKEALGDRPWGVGMLGFVPQQLRQEQMEVIEKHKPPFALIAGGRPDQAKVMEDLGIETYLHVPSPLLLKSFVEMGSRRFIFEGKECGGHVGPRSSFVLWEAMVDVLLSSIGPREDATVYHVLFAGGIHDGLSAAMAAALAAPLAERGVRVGVLVGTAYLFTQEAVDAGAIVKKFQEAAIQCDETVLLETGPGHSIRCIDSPYRSVFDDQRRSLESQNKPREEVRQELELMNLGRLRIASKGLTRAQGKTTADGLQTISDDEQWSSGMYMIGQVAAMHNKVITIEELHSDIAHGGTSIIAALADVAVLSTITGDKRRQAEPIAIIGMACQFPKANDVEMFWQNILNQVDAIEEVPENQWDWRNYYDTNPLLKDKVISKWGGFLADMVFDPSKYGIPPSSLAAVDPMQVLLLETTQAALADAGYAKRGFEKKRTSVLLANAGHGPITALYSLRSMIGWKLQDLDEASKQYVLSQLPEWSEDSFAGYLGNVTAGRVANRFDLAGINFAIDAACASSLAALYVGVNELRAGTSDVVLLAATDTHNQPGDYLSFSNTHALSPSGRCRTFDASADGIAISEGIAMLVLKRLSEAERDGDRIYAVIRGIGGSSDGRDLSLTAPRPAGQMLALERAYDDAGILPNTVQLVEAHGTGTVAGDRAEVEALTKVFRAADAPNGACAIGSVKTNIGHTKAAAGLASLIKVAKSLHHKVLPPTIGVEQPNPSCKFDESPFYINNQTRPWIHSGGEPRRAGVSAFGFGGTNFHVVLEEYNAQVKPAEETLTETLPTELFVWKANTKADLVKMLNGTVESAKALIAASNDPTKSLATSDDARAFADLAYGCFARAADRADAACALTIVAANPQDLQEKAGGAAAKLIEDVDQILDPRGVYFVGKPLAEAGKVAFLFPGQGSQRVEMLRELSLYFPEIAASYKAADEQLSDKFDRKLSSFVYPAPTFSEAIKQSRQTELTNTHVAQPAVGAADVGMLNLLRSFGVQADMFAGHSYGEYVALYAAGAYSLEDLFSISEVRGRLLSRPAKGDSGTMAAVASGVSAVKPILAAHPEVVIANVNAPGQTIISGPKDKVADACKALTAAGLSNKEIAVSAAFHSPLMQPAKAELDKALSEIKFAATSAPVYSNTTTKPHVNDVAAALADHLVKPVDFVGQVRQMHADGARIFVEVGPGAVLTGLVNSILENQEFVALATERSGKHGLTQLQHTLAQLMAHGVPVNLSKLFSRPGMETRIMDLQPKAPRAKLLYRVNSAQIERIGAAPKQKSVPASFKKITGATTGSMDNGTNGKNGGTGMQPLGGLLAHEHSSNGNGNGNGHSNGNGNGNGHHGPAQPLSIRPAAEPVAPNGSQVAAHSELAAILEKNRTATAMPPVPQGQPMPQPTLTQAAFQQQAPVPMQALQQQPVPMAMAMPQMAGRPDANTQVVMMQFQQTMLQMTQSFLETQQRVMLAYLGTPMQQPQFQQPLPAQFAPQLPAQFVPQPPAQFNNGYAQPAVMPWQQPAQPAAFAPQAVSAQSPLSVRQPQSTAPAAQPAASVGQPAASAVPSAEAAHSNGNGSSAAAAQVDFDPEVLVNGLLDIVSQRTGYPPEMLDPTLDLEADLGIDSIKRVEILNNFRKLLPQSMQDRLEGSLEKLAGTKTLQGIIDWIRSDDMGVAATGGQVVTSIVVDTTPEAVQTPAQAKVAKPLPKEVSRGAVKVIDTPLAGTTVKLKSAVVVGDGSGVAKAIVTQLTAQGTKVALLDNASFASLETLSSKIKDVVKQNGKQDAIVHLAALDVKEGSVENAAFAARSLFMLGKVLEPIIAESGERFVIVSATKLGGAFGFTDMVTEPANLPVTAGVVGLSKTFKKEWSDATVRCVDFESTASTADVAKALVGELTTRDADSVQVEVSYQKGKRCGLEIFAAPVDLKATSKIKLDKTSVVLVTGGARGITAEIAVELAEQFQPQMVIVGRLPKPTDSEDADTAKLTTPREIKAAIIERLRSDGQQVSVSAVETIYQQLMREREVRDNLARLKKAGSSVMYQSLDVRDEKQFSQFIDNLYESFGNIDGVVHGAGVIEDAFIKDKTIDSFDRVFFTKVQSAFTLSKSLRFDSLQFMTLFSSIVGRTGNAGQADYVSANEVLNKLAQQLNQTSTARVTSLLWGPWKGGMAQPELEEIFARYGWAMIEIADGRRSFVEELLHGKKSDVEVTLVGKLAAPPLGDGVVDASVTASGARLDRAKVLRAQPGEAAFEITLSTTEDEYLDDHKFDGVPVLPMAMALELLSEAALATFPGMYLRRISEMDIPSGLVFDAGSKKMFISVCAESHADKVVLARVTMANVTGKVHFKALLELGAESAQAKGKTVTGATASVPVVFNQADAKLVAAETTLPTVRHIYENYMFHGPAFQGITGVSALGADGIVGSLAPSTPEQCLKTPGEDAWVIDPILFDSALQLAGVWVRHYMDITVLPTGFKALHYYKEPRGQKFTGRVFIPAGTNDKELLCDLAIYDQSNQLVMIVEGLGGIGNKALNRFATQPKALRSAQ